jgi:DNA-binding NtrC family response regulator
MLTSKPRILVVTGYSDRATVNQSLSAADYEVVSAEDANAAMAQVENPLDLVICDLGPRECDCLALLEKWQALRPGMPFILLAGTEEVSGAIAAMKLGAADYLSKPINGEELLVRVDKWLEASRKDERLHQLESQLGGGTTATSSNGHGGGIDIPAGTSLEDLERAAVEKALQQHRGNRTHAAKTLGISVRTLQRKLKAWRVPMFAVQHHSAPHAFSMSSMR